MGLLVNENFQVFFFLLLFFFTACPGYGVKLHQAVTLYMGVGM